MTHTHTHTHARYTMSKIKGGCIHEVKGLPCVHLVDMALDWYDPWILRDCVWQFEILVSLCVGVLVGGTWVPRRHLPRVVP